ncbi:hypothetical protein TIFTF001_021398 [Ficus carica]|uniref:Pectinesterase n=1 Tax=Ficus carica TaxID=3494 RepID=A0AA88DBU7_FICCA|nr:hypothetical protein TIFTF001_021398 [Ficus carica]
MASKLVHFFGQIILIFFLLSLVVKSSSSSCSLSLERGAEFKTWISWNVEDYRKKTHYLAADQKLIMTSNSPGYNKDAVDSLDEKLKNAEMNKIRISVSQDGSGDFTTITQALNSIPPRNTRRVIITIKPGVYREKIDIPRSLPFVTFFGDAGDPPTITGNDTASGTGGNGKPLRTFQRATVAIEANYFVAVNVKFENTAPHVVGFRKGQAVAVRISGTKAAFYNCSFYGTQDTLYDHKGLHYFHNCFIQGSVDFIFGYGRSFYEKCYMNSTARKVAFLTAQKRTASSLESGFSFKDSVVAGSGQLYLGRAWGDYSRVVFSFTFMDNIVLPRGRSDWGDQKRDSGPGANMTGRVAWARILTDEEAQPFIGTYYVKGDTWLISPN